MEELAHTPEQAEFEVFNPELYRRQQAAADDIARARHAGVESGYLNMATATGKTHVAAESVKRFLAEKPDARVLYLCHQRDILRQARDTFTETLGTSSHGYLFGGEFEDQEQIVYATFQTMTRDLGGGKIYEAYDAEEFDYVVVDESHHGPAPTYREVIEYFQPDFRLGLTATPDRRDQQQISDIFGEELHRLLLEEAIVRGYVADVDYRVLTDHVQRLGELESEPESIPLAAINSEIFVPKRDEEIIEEIERHCEDITDPRVVVFCQNIAHAEHFASLIPGAEAIHSDLLDEVGDDRLARFRTGEIPIVAVVNKLNEGVDIPEANLVVFLRSTESQTIFLQQLGRGLRKIPGKEQVRVLDFVASWERIAMVQELIRGTHETARQTRAARPDSVQGSFSFNFSEEAAQVESLIRHVRDQKQRPKLKALSSRQLQVAEIREMLESVQLPNQRMTEAEAQSYLHRIMKGDLAAREEFLMRRLRLVYARAIKYPEVHGLTVADHFQHGFEGLVKGMDSYDPDKHDYQLSTYISNYVRYEIVRHVKGARLVRIPVNREDRIKIFRKYQEKLGGKLQREPTLEELAEATGTDPEEIDFLFRDDVAYGDLRPVKEMMEVSDTEPTAFERAARSIKHEHLTEALDYLNYRERRVLELRYGLGGEHILTLDEVGRTFNVTRESIRQTENQSLKKLQQLGVAQSLRDSMIDGEEGPESAVSHSRPYPSTFGELAAAEAHMRRRLNGLGGGEESHVKRLQHEADRQRNENADELNRQLTEGWGPRESRPAPLKWPWPRDDE